MIYAEKRVFSKKFGQKVPLKNVDTIHIYVLDKSLKSGHGVREALILWILFTRQVLVDIISKNSEQMMISCKKFEQEKEMRRHDIKTLDRFFMFK